jgi:hypothetical protein
MQEEELEAIRLQQEEFEGQRVLFSFYNDHHSQ